MSTTVFWTTNIELVSSFFSAALGNSYETRSGVMRDVAYTEVFSASDKGNFLILECTEEISEQFFLLAVDNVDSLLDRFVISEIAMGEKFYTVGGMLSVICTLPGNINAFLVQDPAKNSGNIDQSRIATQAYLEWLAKGEVKEAARTAGISPAAIAAVTTPVWKPPPGTLLPSIRPRILHNGVFRSMHVNTTQPVPFSSELFEGQALLIVNTAEETKDAYTSLFKQNKYKFELQVQGKFKSIPAGPIFFGGEITKKMELGMITRGICAGILQIGRTMNAYLHHSFGDKNNIELPHIVGPFWSSVDRLVVTPSGEKAPEFFQSFPEDSKARTARKANPEYTVTVNLDSTYSFSMKTGSMDLEDWAIVPSSYSRSMSLNSFWADADLRFVCYCIPAAAEGVVYTSQGLPKTHPQAQLQHFFSLEVQHCVNHPEWVAGTTEGLDSPRQRLGSDRSSHHRTVNSMTEQDLFQSYESVTLTMDSATGSSAAEAASADEGLRESVTSDADSDEFYDAVEGDLVREGGALFSRPGVHAYIAEENEELALRNSEVSERENGTGISEDASVDGDVQPSAMDLRTRAQASLAETDAAAETERVTTLLSDKLALLQDRILSHSSTHLTHQPSPSRRPPRPPQPPQTDVSIASTMLKRSLIIAILDMDDHRRMKRGKRRTMYAFLSNHSDLREDFHTSGSSGARPTRRYVLHSYGEWKEQLELVKLPAQPPNYARYGDDMKRKAALSWSYECILKGSHHGHLRAKLADFLSDMTHNASFLTPNPHGVGSKKLRVSLPSFTMESLVCVQQGNFSWSEECMGLSTEELIFIKPSKRLGTGVRLRIPLRDVLSARKISETDSPLPLPGSYCMLVCTFAKQYTVLLRGQEDRDAWVSALQSQSFHQSSGRNTATEPSATESVSASTPSSMPGLKRATTIDNTTGLRLSGPSFSFSLTTSPASYTEGLVVYPPDWNLQDRMILNGRNFTCGGFYHQLNLRTLELGRLINDPCRLVEKLLDMAFRLAQIATADDTAQSSQTSVESYAQSERLGPVSWNPSSTAGVYLGEDTSTAAVSSGGMTTTDPEQLWMDFLDGVSLLQCIDLSIVDNTSPEAACLFMNLYHCLLLHAYMVVGLPNSLFKWSHFFRFCSYEAFGDIFSLAELEHCIMRSGMTRPNINFLAQHFLIPHLQYSFAMQVRDYRLLWGIFCGATSNVSEIPIYTPELLDMQLNAIVSASLMSEVKVAGNKITLPAVCQLYAKEFEPSGQTAAPSKAVLRVLLPYLSGELKDSVEALINRPGSFSVRYTPFNFQCRYPTRLQESSLLRLGEEAC